MDSLEKNVTIKFVIWKDNETIEIEGLWYLYEDVKFTNCCGERYPEFKDDVKGKNVSDLYDYFIENIYFTEDEECNENLNLEQNEN